MDIKDQKIITELTKNARISLTALAKKIRLSREVINYRLKNLEKNIIKRHYAVINYQALGFKKVPCFIMLQNCSREFENKCLAYLKSHQYISAISTTIGKWNIVCDIFFKDKLQLQQIIKDIEQCYKTKLKRYFIINTPVQEHLFTECIFGSHKQLQAKQTNKEQKVDHIDLMLLKRLNNNARESLVTMSQKVAIKPNAIAHRIKQLQKKGIIASSTIAINYEALGYDTYNLQIRVNSLEKQAQIASYLSAKNNILYFYRYIGNQQWDIDIGLLINQKNELKESIQDLKEHFGKDIEIHDMYIIWSIEKQNLPEGVLKQKGSK